MKYILKNGIILDGTKDMEPISGKYVVIDDQKISAITDNIDNLTGYEVLDLKGKYIAPGLINMHVHLPGSGEPSKKKTDTTKLVHFLLSNPITTSIAYKMCYDFAKTELMSGVTTIRTVGGISNFDTRIRDEINNGKKIGPRILASNEAVSVPGGHMAGSVAKACTSVEEAVAFVEELDKQKPDLIKLMITGGVLDAEAKGVPGKLKMAPEMVKACCDKAHEKGFKVAAHVESTEGVLVALKNGVDSIEHGAKPTDEMIQLFKEKNAFLCTTISPALPFALFDQAVSGVDDIAKFNGEMVFNGVIDCSKAARENNIPVALGNDVGCPYVTHYDFWRELVYFVKYVGATPKEALYTATLQNATLAGVGDKTGSIEVGKDADIIVVNENPLENLKTLRNVEMVFARGNWINKPQVKRIEVCDKNLDPFLD
jgi:imidazolonepropionase-like amidohydrolase